ncbi:pectate lyase [Maribellus maritimus]|uniref:pectate lyase n=1 Tax=Maribellus maritimus TaxID=2870838 RepID=UPI00374D060C
MNSLIDLYLHSGRTNYLEPVPDAIRWLKASQLPNGKWGRFLELGTNKPLYYDRGRIRVESLEQLSLERRTGYGYETDIKSALKAVEIRYLQVLEKATVDRISVPSLDELARDAEAVIEAQDDFGRWVVQNDKFRQDMEVSKWNGEYRIEDRISSALFNRNVKVLCDYMEAYKRVAGK